MEHSNPPYCRLKSMTGGKQPRRARAALQRWIWFVRFHLFQKRSLKQIRIEQVQGRSLVVTPGVFNPVLFFSSSVLAELLESEALSPKEASVLDLGCGTGVLSVIAASNGEKVVATDLNPQAVRCTRINAILNGVEKRVTVRQGDLFEPVRGESFDVVLFNPPYFGGRPRDTFETSFRSDDMATRLCRRPALASQAGRIRPPRPPFLRGASAKTSLRTCWRMALAMRRWRKRTWSAS